MRNDENASGPPARTSPRAEPRGEPTRRSFLERMAGAVMGFGLVAGYGMFASLVGWFMFPARSSDKAWQFVIDLAGMDVGDSLTYVSPAGQRVVITRINGQGTVEDFIALSSVCPHLGCQVHWEVQNNRFFCPCHNGAFDASGVAIAGPPKDAGQSLPRYPLRIDGGLLFIEVDTRSLV